MSNLTIVSADGGGAVGELLVTAHLVDGTTLRSVESPYITASPATALVAQTRDFTAADGTLTLDLTPNADITPANSCWLVVINSHSYVITKTSSTQTIGQAIAITPAALGSMAGLGNLIDVNLAGLTDTQTLVYDSASGTWKPGTGGGGSTPDATVAVKGKLALTGDLGGTAAAPTVPGLSLAAQKASNLSDLANAATARTNLGLGTAATQASTAFDAAGLATAAQSAAQAFATSADTALIPKSTGTAKGDVVTFTAAGLPSVYSVGVDGTYKVADSTTGTGWADGFVGKPIDARKYGVVADCRKFKGVGSCTSGSNRVTVTGGAFTAGDTGKAFILANNSGAGTDLVVKVTYVSSTQLDMFDLATGATPVNATANMTLLDCAIGTDNSTAFGNAIAAAVAAGVSLYIPAGVYAVAQQVYNNTAMTAAGTGLSIIGDEQGQSEWCVFFDSATSAPLVNVSGQSVGAVTYLATSNAVGDQTLTVVSTANMKVGQYMTISDSSQIIYGQNGKVGVAYLGEVVRVQSITDATHVVLRGKMETALTGGGTTTQIIIQKGSSGYALRNMHITNPVPRTKRGTNSYFTFVNAQDIDIRNNRFDDADHVMVRCQDCVNVRYVGNTIIDAHDGVNNVPYGISLAASTQHVLIEGNFQRNGRHMTTTLPSATRAAPAHILVTGNVATENTAQPFDCHPGTRHWVCQNNFIHNTSTTPELYLSDGNVTNGNGSAIQVRGPDCAVLNNTIIGAFHGIDVNNGADRCRIMGNRIVACDTGIYLQSIDDVRVENNEIINPITYGLVNAVGLGSWPGYETKGLFRNNRVDGTPATAAFAFDFWINGYTVENCVAPDSVVAKKMTGRSATTVASAAPLILPDFGTTFQVTGTTGISSMQVSQTDHGRTVLLRFTGVLTMISGTGLVLNGPYRTVAGNTLELFCDGASWYEAARSSVVNVSVKSTTSSALSLIISDYLVLCDPTSTSQTITLPTAVGSTGEQFIIKRTTGGTNTVTVTTTSSQTIDGATTAVLSTQYAAITVISDGANWQIV